MAAPKYVKYRFQGTFIAKKNVVRRLFAHYPPSFMCFKMHKCKRKSCFTGSDELGSRVDVRLGGRGGEEVGGLKDVIEINYRPRCGKLH